METLKERTLDLKKSLNAVIMAHNHQRWKAKLALDRMIRVS